MKRAVLNNCAAWAMADKDKWISLSGPARWWLKDYDLKDHGFMPQENSEMVEKAFRLVSIDLTDKMSSNEVMKILEQSDRLYEGIDHLSLKI